MKKNLKTNVNQVVRIGLLLIVGLIFVGCAKVPLYTALDERQINEMMAILLSRGIACDKIEGKDGVWGIAVEESRMAESVDVLNAYGYPRDEFQSVGQVFKKSGLVSSPSEERIRFMYALSQDIAETLSRIDGVLTARVHVVLQNNDPLSELKTPSSASVFLKHRRGSGIENLSSQIKRLVANSIEGLSYDKVSLVFVPSDVQAVLMAIDKKEEVTQGLDMRMWLMVGLVVLLLLIVAGTGGYWYWQSQQVGIKKVRTGEEE